jgi:hypothetical protein
MPTGRYFGIQREVLEEYWVRIPKHILHTNQNAHKARSICLCGDDVRKLEPKKRLKFEDLDKSIQKLRAIYKVHPGWFEVPKPKSDKGKNEVDYSI